MGKSGIYIHIPFCKRKCHYCAFVSVCDFSLMSPYVDALISEIKSRSDTREVDTIYFGGGTPSTLYCGALTKIMKALRENFDICENAEITIEANPESVTDAFLAECRSIGVNRISMGLQSSSHKYLEQAGRLHDIETYQNAIHAIIKTGITNISTDLMYGFAGQSISDVISDVDFVCSLPVTHVSVYALSVEEGTPFANNGYEVDFDNQADLYDKIVERLTERGFVRYEISNFSKRGFVSCHNSKYWSGEDYFGFGVSAHSLINDERIENVANIDEYLNGNIVENRYQRTKLDKIEEKIMLSLRTSKGLDINSLKSDYGYDLSLKKKDQICTLENGGFVKVDENILTLTDKGYFVMNAVIEKLIPDEKEFEQDQSVEEPFQKTKERSEQIEQIVKTEQENGETDDKVEELTFEQKKELARKMMSKSTANKNANDRYFDFYDDVKDRTRGYEDW